MALDSIPEKEELMGCMGDRAFDVWESICSFITENYDMDTLWGKGGKAGAYEYKFRKSGKTLCALYPRKQCFGFMVIYGKAEREKFEACRNDFSEEIRQIYDEAVTYHDGKWIMLSISDGSLLEDMKKMLVIKKKTKSESRHRGH